MASAWASRTARRRRRALVVAATSVATAALSSCSSSSCGGPSSALLAEGGGGRDTSAIDVMSVLDGGSGDSAPPVEASTCGPDGSAAGLSDWPGWVRLLGATPACRFDGPTNLSSAIPPWSWIPCTNGAAGCLEFQAGWPLPQGAPFRFQKFAVSHDPLGNAKWLRIERLIDGAATFEDDLYDVASGAPLGAWRRDDLGGDCAIVAFENTPPRHSDPTTHTPLFILFVHILRIGPRRLHVVRNVSEYRLDAVDLAVADLERFHQ